MTDIKALTWPALPPSLPTEIIFGLNLWYRYAPILFLEDAKSNQELF